MLLGGIHMVGHGWGAVIAGEFAFKYGEEDGVRQVGRPWQRKCHQL